jgi:hypothetical protein
LLGGSQIACHYSLNSITLELNLEKLQLIATAKASPASKIKWLEYFNSSASTREARKLPAKPTNEDKLQAFLAKACFWEGVSTCNLRALDLSTLNNLAFLLFVLTLFLIYEFHFSSSRSSDFRTSIHYFLGHFAPRQTGHQL